MSDTYRLFVWEIGGSNLEPTDTGLTGSLGELLDLGLAVQNRANTLTLPDGRAFGADQMAGHVCQPEPEEGK